MIVDKLVRFIQNYLVMALPFVIACSIWGTVRDGEREILRDVSLLARASWELLSWNLMLWFAVLIVFLVLLVVSPEARERTLKRLANLKERDEREQYITGKASRAAYVSTLSILILFLFMSILTLNVSRIPPNEAVEGKTKQVSIGLNFKLTDEPRVQSRDSGLVLFESKDIPLSKTAIILILLSWQLVAFNVSARKEQLQDT